MRKNKDRYKYTTIQLNKKSYDKLMRLKHDLERETKETWSWAKIIKLLCKKEHINKLLNIEWIKVV